MRPRLGVLAVGVVLLGGTPVARAEPVPTIWSAHRPIADAVSTALVAGQLGASVLAGWQAPDRRRALTCQAIQIGAVVGLAELTKALVHRTRPDGSDQKSFFSEHTALAAVGSGWHPAIGVTVTIGAGYLRTAAAKHHWSDVLAGAAVGLGGRAFCHA